MALPVALLVAACSALEEADPTGVFAEPEPVQPQQVSPPGDTGGEGYPNLSAVPEGPPRTPSRRAERGALQRSLAADRANAAYSDEPLRAEGMSAAPVSPAVAAAIAAGPDAPPDASMPRTRAVDLTRRPSGAAAAAPAAPTDAPAEPVIVAGNAEIDPDQTPVGTAPSGAGDVSEPSAPPAEPVIVQGGATVDPNQPAASAADTMEAGPPSVTASGGGQAGDAEEGTAAAPRRAADAVPTEAPAPPGPPTAPEPPAGDVAAARPEAPQREQTAALPPAGQPPAWRVSLAFEAGASSLSPAARESLTALAERLRAEPDSRVQIRAFARRTEESGSRARRLSLSRALEVRAFLTGKGVASTRMDVRALGDSGSDGPLNRVDIQPAER